MLCPTTNPAATLSGYHTYLPVIACRLEDEENRYDGSPVLEGANTLFLLPKATGYPYEWCKVYYLLNQSMVQSSSLEANWFAVCQEIPRISRNLKVHYRTHKRPPPVSILGQPNPVHTPTSHLLQLHPNIIHASTPRSP